MRKCALGLILFTLIFTGCFVSRTTILTPDFQDTHFQDAALLIAPVQSVKFIQNEDIEDDLQGQSLSEEKHLEYISKALLDKIRERTTFSMVRYVDFKEDPKLEARTLTLPDGDTFDIALPSTDEPIMYESRDPVFVLFIEEVEIGVRREHQETSQPVKHYTVSGLSAKDEKVHQTKNYKYFAVGNMKYAIIENNSAKLVGYGKISQDQNYLARFDIEHNVDLVLKNMVSRMVKKTPFEARIP